MTLAACRSGASSRQLLYELIRLNYLSYFFWEAGYGMADYQLHCSAEGALEQLAGETKGTTTWQLDEDSFEQLRKIITVYDNQISAVSGLVFKECKIKLDNLLHVRIPAQVAAAKEERRRAGVQHSSGPR
jgi:hypothetical protein